MQVRPMAPLKPTSIMKEKIFIKTNRLGFIPQINMQGPIITPIPVSREVAKSMIVVGIEVFEVYKDSDGKKHIRLLTLQNVYPGEGDNNGNNKPSKPDDNEDGVQKPTVPTTSGVAQKTPVQPVKLKGVSIQSETVEPTSTEEEDSEEDLTEEMNEDKTEEKKTNTVNENAGKKKNKMK